MPDLLERPDLFVRLTIFKHTGKYYCSSGYYHTDVLAPRMDEIHAEVRLFNKRGKLPGLIEGHDSDWIILVEVPDHPSNRPKLIIG